MPYIAANDDRLIEEHVFGLFLRNLMSLPILLNIGFVPIETNATVQRVFPFRHDPSI